MAKSSESRHWATESTGTPMSVNLLVDMNLSPDWVPVPNDHGWPAIHWSAVGDARASDRLDGVAPRAVATMRPKG